MQPRNLKFSGISLLSNKEFAPRLAALLKHSFIKNNPEAPPPAYSSDQSVCPGIVLGKKR